MCLAIPAKLEKIDDPAGPQPHGTVELDGTRANVSLALVPGAKLGDWVLVHAGMAITVLDPAEAKETYDLLKEMETL
jgi:hydrogenase expression/formation protein HypC